VVHEVHSAERADIASSGDEVRKPNYAGTPRFLISSVALTEVAANDHIWSLNAVRTRPLSPKVAVQRYRFQGINPVADHVHGWT